MKYKYDKPTKIKLEILRDMIKDLDQKIDEYREDGSKTSLMAVSAYESIKEKLYEEIFMIERNRPLKVLFLGREDK